ncbi:M23 family metallopeptidase [Nocardioides sp. BP30]|uniref:M23 family metallopeptidase n=1 Tax=Nocardioides sp. BP30 TaxID=3036374 RepID=UPI002468420D|nr:M23 family metallopeptidase [Nocardioides sp. BP30]WGL53513.1 M23 family metallopeptidase [Nocardioides sp. BP30]
MLAATIAATAVGGLTVPVAYASDHHQQLKQQQKQAQQHVATVQNDLDDSSAALQKAATQLADAKAQLVKAQAHLADVNTQLGAAQQVEAQAQAALTQAQTALAQATDALDAGQQAVDAQRDEVKRTVLSTYTAGDPGLLEVGQLLDATSPSDIVRQLSYGQVVSTAETNSYKALQSAEVVLKVKQQNLAAAKEKVADQEQVAAQHLTEVQDLQQQASAAASSVASLVARAAAAKAAARQTKKDDEKQLQQAKAQEQKITQQILAASKHGAKRHVSSTSGMFQKPVANTYITSPYGWRIHPIYHYWGLHDGDDFHAPCGTHEVAVGTGRVVSEYYSSVWGNRLYLDLGTINGDQYTAIYNHIEDGEYKAKVGQVVGQGQTIALAGTTGWSTACHLHFTIMRNGTAIDPMSVLG